MTSVGWYHTAGSSSLCLFVSSHLSKDLDFLRPSTFDPSSSRFVKGAVKKDESQGKKANHPREATRQELLYNIGGLEASSAAKNQVVNSNDWPPHAVPTLTADTIGDVLVLVCFSRESSRALKARVRRLSITVVSNIAKTVKRRIRSWPLSRLPLWALETDTTLVPVPIRTHFADLTRVCGFEFAA